MPFAYAYTDCDTCGRFGPNEEKTLIRYDDDDAVLGLCPECFADWQEKYHDDGTIIHTGNTPQINK